VIHEDIYKSVRIDTAEVSGGISAEHLRKVSIHLLSDNWIVHIKASFAS